MTSHSNSSSAISRRHDLVYVRPASWRSVLKSLESTAPLLTGWAERGWPLIARQFEPFEGKGVPLGLPLPPSAGKGRMKFLIEPADVISTSPPPNLNAALSVAPDHWAPTLVALRDMGIRYGVEVRVFGSLAWTLLTGMEYLTPGSDLDFILSFPRLSDFGHLITELAALDHDAPIRLDGELFREDGAGVSWRELHGGAREVLVKSLRGPLLLTPTEFIYGSSGP